MELGQTVHDSSTKDGIFAQDELDRGDESGKPKEGGSQERVESELIHELTDRYSSLTLDDYGHLRLCLADNR